MLRFRKTEDPGKAILIAHRGGKGEAFENSLQAFQRSILLGCDSIELDLRATRNGRIVVMHDATLGRTTSGKGKVRDFDLAQLDDFFLRNGEPIPVLEEVLEIAKGKILLHLEIKEPGFEKHLVSLLKSYAMVQGVYIISFHSGILQAIKKLCPDLKTGFLFSEEPGKASSPKSCDLLLPRADLLSKNSLQAFQKDFRKIHTWVINDPKKAVRLSSTVDGIITDYPEAILKVLAGKKKERD